MPNKYKTIGEILADNPDPAAHFPVPAPRPMQESELQRPSEVLTRSGDLTRDEVYQMSKLTEYVHQNAQKYPALAQGLMRALEQRRSDLMQGKKRAREPFGKAGKGYADGKLGLRAAK